MIQWRIALTGTILWLSVDNVFAWPRQLFISDQAQFLLKKARGNSLACIHLGEEKTMFSRSLGKISGVVLFCLVGGTTASAQYNGPGSGGTGTGAGTGMGATGMPNYSYGNGKAIGIGVGATAGVAVGIALYVHHRHVKAHEAAQAVQTPKSEASIIGCMQATPSGLTLKNENDNMTYTILSNSRAKL
jgi:hypothetical protein